jgi:PAS domain S-box-containing protein
MNSRSQLLYLEDDLADVQLLQDALQTDGLACDITHVDTERGFLAALQQDSFDLILADYTLPSFDGLSALRMAQQQKSDLPFIFVSGTMGEEVAIEALKTGATDYVLKTRLSRLAPAVRRALREARERRDLRSAERELRQREAEIRRLVDASIIGIFIWDAEGKILEANDAFLRMMGYSREELLSREMCWTDLTPPEWLDRDERLWVPKLKMAGSLQPFEQEYLRKDGSRVPVLIGAASFDESVNRGVAFVLDLTERKRAEEAARRSQRELRDVIETIPAVAWSALADGSNAFVNSRWTEFTGLSAEQTAGSGWHAAIHPDDVQRHIDRWRRCVVTGEPLEIEVRMRGADGQFRSHLCRGVPLRDEIGSIVKWYGVLTDIEDRKRAEEALKRSEFYLREAQKLTHTGSWVLNAGDRTWVHVSEEWYRIFGIDPADGASNWEKRLDRVHPDDRLVWKNTIERAIVDKTDYDITFRIVLPGGIVKWIRTVGHPILTATGDLVQFLGSSTDISAHKRAEQEHEKLRQLEAELAHINRVSMLGEMAASLAHEIKQPLAAAIASANSCIEWLAHEPPNLDRARAAATRIDKYGNRAAEIVNRVRSLYRKSPPQRELVDVNGIVEEMLTLLQGEATRYPIAMRTELTTDLPEIMADRVQLQQVFMNLMLNAIEAMENSGGELMVKSQLQDGQLQFSVSDTGVGLPREQMAQIFSVFFTTKPQGSGMGLAISRSIVESHGGRLWATANDGRGATFHFTLPTQATETSV